MIRTVLAAVATTAAIAAVTVAPAEAAAYGVTLKTDAPKTDVKDTFRLSGQVTGSGAGNKSIIIQRKIGSAGWKNYSTATTRPTGTYSKTFTMLSPGAKQFRVLVPKAGSLTTGTSNTKTVTGYSWLSLAKRGTESIAFDFSSNVFGISIVGNNVSTRVDGHTYPHSIRFTELANSEGAAKLIIAKVDGLCDEASFGYGFDEKSPEGSSPVPFLAFGSTSVFTEAAPTEYYVGADETPSLVGFEHKKIRAKISSNVKYFVAGTQGQSGEFGNAGTAVFTTPRVHCAAYELPDSDVAEQIFGSGATRSSTAQAFRP